MEKLICNTSRNIHAIMVIYATTNANLTEPFTPHVYRVGSPFPAFSHRNPYITRSNS